MHMVGLDLKHDVITHCEQLSQSLGYEKDLQFIEEDINTFNSSGEIDLVVSLHACDTATDAALEKAIRWQAKVILCVPCCQHELMNQVAQESLSPLLRHGILKERFAALATDAATLKYWKCSAIIPKSWNSSTSNIHPRICSSAPSNAPTQLNSKSKLGSLTFALSKRSTSPIPRAPLSF